MSLADIPTYTRCHVKAVSWAEDNLKYIKAGVSRGSNLRVICRYPDSKPKFVEVELENKSLITLPLSFAKEVTVEIADTA
ncbi:MAG: hypothetical protein KGZ93_07355 [Actinobacteria bacterium]|nr:hypothetical protein [Actinomycetota bacterium]